MSQPKICLIYSALNNERHKKFSSVIISNGTNSRGAVELGLTRILVLIVSVFLVCESVYEVCMKTNSDMIAWHFTPKRQSANSKRQLTNAKQPLNQITDQSANVLFINQREHSPSMTGCLRRQSADWWQVGVTFSKEIMCVTTFRQQSHLWSHLFFAFCPVVINKHAYALIH